MSLYVQTKCTWNKRNFKVIKINFLFDLLKIKLTRNPEVVCLGHCQGQTRRKHRGHLHIVSAYTVVVCVSQQDRTFVFIL